MEKVKSVGGDSVNHASFICSGEKTMLSGTEQEQMQLAIDQRTADERATLMANSRRALQNAREAMNVSVLTREQRHAIERHGGDSSSHRRFGTGEGLVVSH